MITKENYFQKIKSYKATTFPNNIFDGYKFTIAVTDNHKTWKYYDADKDIKAKVDEYFKLLNEHFKFKSPITKTEAKEYAKNLVGYLISNGETLESLSKSYNSIGYTTIRANIKNAVVTITKIRDTTILFSFPLEEIYNSLDRDNFNASLHGTTEEVKQTTVAPSGNNHVRIDYEHSKPVERISEEIKFMKRYLTFHNRRKTRLQVSSFIKALKIAFMEQRIRATSKYAAEIYQIQNQLLSAFKVMSNNQKFTLGADTIENMSAIVGSVQVRASTQYLKRFIGIEGKLIGKEKAQNLYDTIVRGLDMGKISQTDQNIGKIKTVIKSLKKFLLVAGKNAKLDIHEETLSGLNDALGCLCEAEGENEKNEPEELAGLEDQAENFIEEEEEPEVIEDKEMSIEEVRNMQFDTVKITGMWLQLIGAFCVPTHFFVYGPGGGGKTSWVLLFTQYLSTLGYKVLYISAEQYGTPTLKALLQVLDIKDDAGNFKFAPDLQTSNPAEFDFVVLDSKDFLARDPKDFQELRAKYKKQSFILLSQAVKKGGFTGKEIWRNHVDVMVRAESGFVVTGEDKNRWGGSGNMQIYDYVNRRKMIE